MMAQHGMLAGSFVIFQGIRTSIAKEPYIFVNFSRGGGGVWTPCPLFWIPALQVFINYKMYIFIAENLYDIE